MRAMGMRMHCQYVHALVNNWCSQALELLPTVASASGGRISAAYIAHNTVRVDGRDQAISRGVFDWERRVDARLIGAITDEGYDVFAAYHDAYAPVRHTRFVIVIHKRFWMVIDYLSGDVSSGHKLGNFLAFGAL